MLTIVAMLLCAGAFADEITPIHTVNMEATLSGSELPVDIESDDVTDNSVYVTVYETVSYSPEDVEKLAVGDTVVTSEGDVTVNALSVENGEVLINGGADEGGVTLYLNSEDGRYYEMDFEYYARVPVGQAQLNYADQVEVRVYNMDEDFSMIDDTYNTELVPADQVAAALLQLCDTFGGLNSYQTTAQVENDVLTGITVNYMP